MALGGGILRGLRRKPDSPATAIKPVNNTAAHPYF
jgi:hypothetical protein